MARSSSSTVTIFLLHPFPVSRPYEKTDPPGNTTLSFEPEVAVKDRPLLLTCGASDLGQPTAVQYRWTRNGHVIPEITDSYWNVTRVTLNYQANYSCTPVNEAGEGESAEIEVEVFGEFYDEFYNALKVHALFFISRPELYRTPARHIRSSGNCCRQREVVVPSRVLPAVPN